MRLILIIIFFHASLFCAESINDGEHVIVYDDGLLAGIAKLVVKDLKGNFKKRKIKWTVNSIKQGTFDMALKSIEKDVIRKKPDIVVLSFGMLSELTCKMILQF